MFLNNLQRINRSAAAISVSALVSLSLSLSLSTLLAFSTAAPARAEAELFSKLSFKEAKAKAEQEKKLLLLDFTATWCPPCQMMERTTWQDAELKAFVEANAVAVQIDVDKDQATTSKLGVRAMPTLVLFKPGSEEELGRKLGYTQAAELLRWLEGAKSGKSADELKDESDSSSFNGLLSRFGEVQENMKSGKYAEALTDLLWLWKNAEGGEGPLKMMRFSLLPASMHKLLSVYPEAKPKLEELRDSAEKSGKRNEWAILNGVLGDDAKTLAWFDKAKLDPAGRAEIEKSEKALAPVIFSSQRYADAAQFLYPDAIAKVNEQYKRCQKLKNPGPDTEVAKDFNPFPNSIVLVYAAYLGAGRADDVAKIKAECIKLDASPQMKEVLEKIEKDMSEAKAGSPNNATVKPVKKP